MLKLIKKILTHQNRIGRDKLAHFYSGALGFTLFSILINPIWASVIVVGAGVFKEIYDIMYPNDNTHYVYFSRLYVSNNRDNIINEMNNIHGKKFIFDLK